MNSIIEFVKSDIYRPKVIDQLFDQDHALELLNKSLQYGAAKQQSKKRKRDGDLIQGNSTDSSAQRGDVNQAVDDEDDEEDSDDASITFSTPF